MNGKIWVESELGQGSRFYFIAVFEVPELTHQSAHQPTPTATNVAADTVAKPTARESALRILMAEDNLVNQRLAMRLLQKQGHNVTVANNGREAIRVLEQSNWEFDCILMDIQMPEMDGLEATKAIRKIESSGNAHLPIIALTAHALERDKELCLSAGMDRHLTKPIQMEVLLSVLEEVAAGTLGCAGVR
jgi:CheY-like chemotaxis protein